MDTINVEHKGKVVHDTATPKRVKVERGQRGGYGWELEIKGHDDATMLDWIDQMDERLRQTYQADISP